MRRWYFSLLPLIAFWFGLGVLLAYTCSLQFALFIAIVLLLILACRMMKMYWW